MAKYTFSPTLTKEYVEVSQNNPMRWEILYKEENHFTPQTGKFKCKDFFNDLVCKIQTGGSFHIYGMDLSTVKLNDEGVYLRLSYIESKRSFVKNINNVINKLFFESYGESITIESLPKKGEVLCFIPKITFSSTYLISLVSWLIRLSNTKEDLKDFEYAIKESVAVRTDCPLQASGKVLALSWKFKLKAGYKEYWYWSGDNYNSKTITSLEQCKSIIHNNGVASWANWVSI